MLHAALEMQVWTWESLRTLMGLSEQVHSRVKDWNPCEGWAPCGTNREMEGGWQVLLMALWRTYPFLPPGEHYLCSPLPVYANEKPALPQLLLSSLILSLMFREQPEQDNQLQPPKQMFTIEKPWVFFFFF